MLWIKIKHGKGQQVPSGRGDAVILDVKEERQGATWMREVHPRHGATACAKALRRGMLGVYEEHKEACGPGVE